MARIGQFRRLAKSAGFRRNPREHAGVGAIGQEKTPTENGWGFIIGGGRLTMCWLASRADERWRGLLRELMGTPHRPRWRQYAINCSKRRSASSAGAAVWIASRQAPRSPGSHWV